MIGWVILAGFAAAVALLLWRIGFPARLWSFAAAALMLAAAGYAWQGHPELPDAPVSPAGRTGSVDPVLVEMRGAMFGRFDFDYGYVMAADAMMRRGSPQLAVKALLGGIARSPKSVALWTALGLTLAQHDGNNVSPPARFAFERAMALSPQHPGPAFFLGLAEIRAENFAEARRRWAQALALTPPDASYRTAIAERLMLLDRLLAATATQPGAAPK